MKARISHGLEEKDAAIKQAQHVLLAIQNDFPVITSCRHKKWDGRSYQFTLFLMKLKFVGHIYVTSLEVELYADMPFGAVRWRRALEKRFAELMKNTFPNSRVLTPAP